MALDIIEAIYQIKNENEKIVLSSGHSGIALYTVMEHHGLLTSQVIDSLNIHPDLDPANGIYASSGSLGQGLPIAAGMALANRSKRVFCVISDGECAEGSIWETLRIVQEQKLNNLVIILNANGYGAYDEVSSEDLLKRIQGFGYIPKVINGHNIDEIIQTIIQNESTPKFIFAKTNSEQFPFLKGLDAHYYVMNDQDYQFAIDQLK